MLGHHFIGTQLATQERKSSVLALPNVKSSTLSDGYRPIAVEIGGSGERAPCHSKSDDIEARTKISCGSRHASSEMDDGLRRYSDYGNSHCILVPVESTAMSVNVHRIYAITTGTKAKFLKGGSSVEIQTTNYRSLSFSFGYSPSTFIHTSHSFKTLFSRDLTKLIVLLGHHVLQHRVFRFCVSPCCRQRRT